MQMGCRDSLKTLMKMETNVNEQRTKIYVGWHESCCVHLVQFYCFQPLGRIIVTFCKLQIAITVFPYKSDFILSFFLSVKKKLNLDRSFFEVIICCWSSNIVNESVFKFRRIFYTAISIICCLFLFCNMREILTRNVYSTKFSNFHENIAVCRN